MLVVQPSELSEKEFKRLIKKFSSYQPSELSLLWIPYSIIECSYVDKRGFEDKASTAFNKMFPTDEMVAEDLLLLFRPNLIKYPTLNRNLIRLPEALKSINEVYGCLANVKLEEVSRKLSVLLSRIDEKLKIIPRRVRKSSMITRLFLPDISSLTEDPFEKERSELFSIKLAAKILLNLKSFPKKVNMVEKGMFYHPYLLIKSKDSERFSFINLVKTGKFFGKFIEDKALSKIVDRYDENRKMLSKI